jgi:hypothetical protein
MKVEPRLSLAPNMEIRSELRAPNVRKSHKKKKKATSPKMASDKDVSIKIDQDSDDIESSTMSDVPSQKVRSRRGTVREKGEVALLWRNLSYSVELVEWKRCKHVRTVKTLLSDINGCVLRGETVALLGGSGAGKVCDTDDKKKRFNFDQKKTKNKNQLTKTNLQIIDNAVECIGATCHGYKASYRYAAVQWRGQDSIVD